MELTTSHLLALLAFFAVHIGTAIWWMAKLSGRSLDHERRIEDLESNLGELVKSLIIEQKRGLERSGLYGRLELRLEHVEQEVEILRTQRAESGGAA